MLVYNVNNTKKFMSFIDEVPSDNLISMHTKSPEELWAETVDRHNSNLVKEPIHYSFTSLRLYMTARIEPSSALSVQANKFQWSS